MTRHPVIEGWRLAFQVLLLVFVRPVAFDQAVGSG